MRSCRNKGALSPIRRCFLPLVGQIIKGRPLRPFCPVGDKPREEIIREESLRYINYSPLWTKSIGVVGEDEGVVSLSHVVETNLFHHLFHYFITCDTNFNLPFLSPIFLNIDYQALTAPLALPPLLPALERSLRSLEPLSMFRWVKQKCLLKITQEIWLLLDLLFVTWHDDDDGVCAHH